MLFTQAIAREKSPLAPLYERGVGGIRPALEHVRSLNEPYWRYPSTPVMSDILYGIHPVREAIAARGDRIREIWVSLGSHGRPLRELTAEAQALGIQVRFQQRGRL